MRNKTFTVQYDICRSSRRRRITVKKKTLTYQGAAISPAEVVVKHLIIQTNPLIVLSKICNARKNILLKQCHHRKFRRKGKFNSGTLHAVYNSHL